MEKQKNYAYSAKKLGWFHIAIAISLVLFLVSLLIIVWSNAQWLPENNEGLAGVGTGFAVVLFIIFGGLGYGIIGVILSVICTVHGVRLCRATEERPVGRGSMVACFVCKLVAVIVMSAVGVLCTAMLVAANAAIAALQAVLLTIPVCLQIIGCVWEMRLIKSLPAKRAAEPTDKADAEAPTE